MFYSSQAEGLRTFLKDKLGLAGIDVGGGWLIFDAPEADLGVHPTEERRPPFRNSRHLVLLRRRQPDRERASSAGVEFTQDVEDHGYGLVTFFKVPALPGSALPAEIRQVGHHDK